MNRLLALVVVVVAAAPAYGKPPVATRAPTAKRPAAAKPASDPKKIGAVARVAFGRDMRPARDVIGRRQDPLTDEEAAAAKIQNLLRGPLLRRGVTGLFVADAKTGEPIFAVNAEDPLNPASNVKMISTATSLELLGASYRFPTRVMGPTPIGGVVKGDIYLLGSHDPTLVYADFDQLAATLQTRGITRIEGSVLNGADPTRDGIYRAQVPITIAGGSAGGPAVVSPPSHFELVTIKNTATTLKYAARPRLSFKVEETRSPSGQPRIVFTVGGSIGLGGKVDYPIPATTQRAATAGYALLAALRNHGITVTGDYRSVELGDFVGDAVAKGALPVELGRHESATIAEIVQTINKWSINWLADRLVMTAAGLKKSAAPSMELALDAMYSWLDRHPHVAKKDIVIDTGSGLSYKTQISAHELVSIVRSAGGFSKDADPVTAKAWLASLSIAGTDGTLRGRFRGLARGKLIGKTGSLSTVIALSGVLDIDPQRPLVFALVTNTDSPLSKPIVRQAHEQVIGEVMKYLAKTARAPIATPTPPQTPPAPAPTEGEPEENPDTQLDNETANHK